MLSLWAEIQIVTDHAAIKWLITVKNHHCARLTRWVLKLAENEFEIKYKPGKKHVNADSLSRHIASMTPEEAILKEMSDLTEVGLTREVVLEEHRKDAYCRGKVEDIKAQQELGFVFSADGLLYKGDKLNEAKLVVPEKLTRAVIRIHHDKVFVGHQGIK